MHLEWHPKKNRYRRINTGDKQNAGKRHRLQKQEKTADDLIKYYFFCIF
jgi:hypothetical protein